MSCRYLSYKLPVYFPSVSKSGKLIIEQCCTEIHWRTGKIAMTQRIKWLWKTDFCLLLENSELEGQLDHHWNRHSIASPSESVPPVPSEGLWSVTILHGTVIQLVLLIISQLFEVVSRAKAWTDTLNLKRGWSGLWAFNWNLDLAST